MFKRINWKAIGKGLAWAICLSGVVVLMSFIDTKKQTVRCSDVKILIPGADNFIEREEIDAILMQSQGTLVGKPLEEINTHEIEKTIQANPYIAFAKVYADMDGVIQIQIRQRQPVLRIINAGGQDYYIDRDGLKMPMSPNFTANVLVATGDIFEGYGGRVDTLITPLAADLYKAALFIKQDTLWDAQIEQIFVNGKSDIELIPRVGNQRIILGNADSLSVKMGNLLAFYKQAMPQVGWDAYKTINIKYINQIICEKNVFDSSAVRRKVALVDSASIASVVTDSAIKVVAPVVGKKEIKSVATAEVKKSVPKVLPPREVKSQVTSETKKVVPKEASAKEVKAGTPAKSEKVQPKEKPAVKADPTLYKPPVKSTTDKAKSEALSKDKTDTKKKINSTKE
ncbi:MAG: cell division protein FtsQ/DivIB [Bacteroidia bacterium]